MFISCIGNAVRLSLILFKSVYSCLNHISLIMQNIVRKQNGGYCERKLIAKCRKSVVISKMQCRKSGVCLGGKLTFDQLAY